MSRRDFSQTRDGLRLRILRFFDDPTAEPFDELALAVFRCQWRANHDYRRLLELQGVEPEEITTWPEIPPVSTVTFKHLKLHSGPSPIVFRTSGTTRGPGLRGEHHLRDAMLYRAALRRQFRRHVLPDRKSIRMLALTPSPRWAPDSSLGFMVDDLIRVMGEPGSGFFLSPDGLDHEALAAALRSAEAEGMPVALLGVVFGFVHLLEGLSAAGISFRLPPGSRIMDTGGLKGLSRVVAREDLLRDYEALLGIPPNRVVNEYGMTELGSQFYDRSLEGIRADLKVGPHWVRTLIIDPESGEPATPGAFGLLRHVDLANLDSVIAIETEDVGRFPGDESEGFELRGRVSGAEPRGCSIAVDDLLSGGAQ